MKSILTATLALATALTGFASDISKSVIRVSSTLQSYNPSQPWDKTAPEQRHGLGAILNNHQVLITAEMVTNANFIELESANGQHKIPAKVASIDYESNLALLEAISKNDSDILSSYTSLDISAHAHPGDAVELIQIEGNGMPLITEGRVLAADVLSSFVPGHEFLTYEIKASMQSAESSYTIPILHKGKLLGLLSSYSSKDQLVDIIAPEIVSAFLEDAKDGDYQGFPSLGIEVTDTSDKHFRSWLKLPQDTGGLYITRVVKNSSAAQSGIKKGDVLLSIDGHAVDRRGYYEANGFGQIFWSHLIRGSQTVGNQVTLDLLRDGKTIQHTVTLNRKAEGIIPSHTYGQAPRYLIKGGIVFQELTQTYLQAFGDNWTSRAPLNLLDAFNHPEDYEKDLNRIVFISTTLPTPATLGYESLRSVIVEEVNGQKIKDIPSLVEAFKKTPKNGIHVLKIDSHPDTVYLDASASDTVDDSLLQRGLPALSRE